MIPVKNAILTHLAASRLAVRAASLWPEIHNDSTLVALIIATIPNGRQHKKVTRMDSTSQFLGGASLTGGILIGGPSGEEKRFDGGGTVNSLNWLAGIQSAIPSFHTSVVGV